jgi:hypothetical protein
LNFTLPFVYCVTVLLVTSTSAPVTDVAFDTASLLACARRHALMSRKLSR